MKLTYIIIFIFINIFSTNIFSQTIAIVNVQFLIDKNKIYSVVSNNYVRNGGDGYKMFRKAIDAYDYGPDLADVTAEYMASKNGYTPYLDGRITIIK